MVNNYVNKSDLLRVNFSNFLLLDFKYVHSKTSQRSLLLQRSCMDRARERRRQLRTACWARRRLLSILPNNRLHSTDVNVHSAIDWPITIGSWYCSNNVLLALHENQRCIIFIVSTKSNVDCGWLDTPLCIIWWTEFAKLKLKRDEGTIFSALVLPSERFQKWFNPISKLRASLFPQKHFFVSLCSLFLAPQALQSTRNRG